MIISKTRKAELLKLIRLAGANDEYLIEKMFQNAQTEIEHFLSFDEQQKMSDDEQEKLESECYVAYDESFCGRKTNKISFKIN